MRRLELTDGSSAKLWEIELTGTGFTVRYGRLGTNASSPPRSLPTDATGSPRAHIMLGR